MVITLRAHTPFVCAIHHLKALTEEIAVSKYPHCLFYKSSPKGFPNFFCLFLAITFEPQMLESLSNLPKTRTITWFPIKLSQKIGSCCWCPWPDNLIQICINLLPLWCHQQKNKNLTLSNFSLPIETTRLSASVQCLSSSPLLKWLVSYGGWTSVNMAKVTFCRSWYFIKTWVFEP